MREEAAQSDRRRHPRGADSKQRGGARPNFNFDVFIEGEDAPGFDSSRRGCHGDGAVKNERRHAAAWRRRQAGGGARLQIDFLSIYRIATEFFLQITHKFSKEVENLQK